MKKPSADDLVASAWSAAFLETATPADVVPAGWHLVRDLAKTLKTPVPTLQVKLKRLLTVGKAERKMFRIKLSRQTRPVPHYRLLK